MQNQPGRHALVFIFFTVLIDSIGFGVILPVMPRLLTVLMDQISEHQRDLTNSASSRSSISSRRMSFTYCRRSVRCPPQAGGAPGSPSYSTATMYSSQPKSR